MHIYFNMTLIIHYNLISTSKKLLRCIHLNILCERHLTCLSCYRSIIIGCLSMITKVRRNFWIRGAKQLKNLEQLKKYRESPEFKKLSEQNKKNRNSDQDGVAPSLHTCGSITVTEWHRQLVRTHS